MIASTDTRPRHPADTLPRHVEVAVLGAGFSGLGMAIQLRRHGIDDFVVLERGDDVGGTWHYNTYPGCACDVPSHLYSFSFAPNPDWTHTYSPQPEIRDYLRRCADDFGIRPYVRLRQDVKAVTWDDGERVWRVETGGGTMTARVVVSALGPLTEPKVPDVPGLDGFEGETFHSARWNHDYDLTGKRVASIGTGASAIQYVPEIQPRVERLHVFQRTAPWIVPHSNRPIRDWERALYRGLPAAQRLVRGGVYVTRELLVPGFVREPRLMKVVERVARRHMRRQISDPELIRRVTPDYTIGCKRILPSNRWYRALDQDNVELVTDGIREVRAHSIVDGAGVEREVDAIVFGTGFRVTDMPAARHLRGRDGRLLHDVWERDGARAYLGTAAAGFPNLFLLLGPNTGLGHSSMVYMIESQIDYVLDALRTMHRHGLETVEVREETVARYNDELARKLDRTVWNTGCASWYLDDTGRNATQWPDWTWRFRERTARFDPADYVVRTPERAPEPVPLAA